MLSEFPPLNGAVKHYPWSATGFDPYRETENSSKRQRVLTVYIKAMQINCSTVYSRPLRSTKTLILSLQYQKILLCYTSSFQAVTKYSSAFLFAWFQFCNIGQLYQGKSMKSCPVNQNSLNSVTSTAKSQRSHDCQSGKRFISDPILGLLITASDYENVRLPSLMFFYAK